MSSDDRFREMFYEEARELLIGLEEGLMDLERRQSDRAHLDRTFRAAHSLKGAAGDGGAGGDRRVHARDRGRAGPDSRRELSRSTPTSSRRLLEARDHLAMMVEAEAVKSPIPASGELSQRLILLLRGPGSPGSRTGAAGRAPQAIARSRAASRGRERPPESQTQAEAGAAQDEENGGEPRQPRISAETQARPAVKAS